jgi:hypothetical protein
MGVLDNFVHDPQQQMNKHKYRDYNFEHEKDLKEFSDLERAVTAKSNVLSLDPAPYSYSNSPQKSGMTSSKDPRELYKNGPRYTMERTSNEKKYEDYFKKKEKDSPKFENNFFLESEDLEVKPDGEIV